MGLRWQGLPDSPQNLIKRGKKVIHSTKFWKDINQKSTTNFLSNNDKEKLDTVPPWETECSNLIENIKGKLIYEKIFTGYHIYVVCAQFCRLVYIAGNAVFHPNTCTSINTFLSWPREDTFGIISFSVSIISLCIYDDTG